VEVVVARENASASDPALLAIEGVSKIYRMGDVDVAALKDVSLTIERGDLVAIMGSSGSGKSTLMNILGCLDRPTKGRYLIDGREVSKLDKDELALVRNRTLGFVFQSFHLLARTSAVDNVELPLLYSNTPARERRKRAAEALERVGLGRRLDHHPSQLSGGQQQRVAIARALVTQPKLILADEPTGNLDSKTSIDVMALFQDLGAEGITRVLVTHEPDIASYADRVIVMRDGVVVEDRRQQAVRAQHPPEAAEARP
jgi:putative ABC transport system ATP-binding protein